MLKEFPIPPRALLPSLIASLFLTSQVRLDACGIDWSLPTNHFEGVNERGFTSYWQSIGEIDLGDGFKLPLHINFRSNREAVSPYLGHGWTLSLLESHIVQINEREFMLVQPEGRYRLFGRSKSDPKLLHGQGNWRAVIDGDKITAWADCGWKLIYSKGRLASIITPKNRRLDFVYSGRKVTEIREAGATVLTVEPGSVEGAVAALVFNRKRLELFQGPKPRVQVIKDQKLVSGIDQGLSKITQGDAALSLIEYSVDENMNPTLKLGDRVLAWDPGSKLAIQDDDWKYQINPGSGMFDNAKIERKNSKNQTEFWHRDDARGEEVVQELGGVKTVKTWFTSGKLAGNVRRIATGNGIAKYTYDEHGRLLRVDSPLSTSIFDSGQLRSIYDKSSDAIAIEINDNKTHVK